MNAFRKVNAGAIALALLAAAPVASPAAPDCLNDNALPVRVRIADLGPEVLDAVLVGGPEQGLELRDARSGTVWWSAGVRAADVQRFDGMGRIAARPAAVDLDGDGIDDRIYALDASGTLWRLDLSALRPRDRWAEGGILAQLSVDAGQRFVAPLDVALQVSGPAPWISLAFGSVTLGTAPAADRFYVLRDRYPFSTWGAVPERAGWPIIDADLRVAESAALEPESAANGFYLHLGAGQVIAASLTVAGRVVFTTAQLALRLVGNCLQPAQPGERAPMEVRAVRADGGADPDSGKGAGREPIHLGQLPINSSVEIAAGEAFPGPRPCVVGGIAIPGCGIDTRVERTWWLREDAD